MSTSYWDNMLSDIHNIELDPEELTFAEFEVVCQDLTLEECIVIHKNLTRLKQMILKRKRKLT